MSNPETVPPRTQLVEDLLALTPSEALRIDVNPSTAIQLVMIHGIKHGWHTNLTNQQKMFMLLAYGENLTSNEIAQILPAGNRSKNPLSRSRISQIRQDLYQKVANLLPEDDRDLFIQKCRRTVIELERQGLKTTAQRKRLTTRKP